MKPPSISLSSPGSSGTGANPGSGSNKPQWLRCRETGNATHGLLVTKEEYDAVLRYALAAPSTHKSFKSSKLEGELLEHVDYIGVKKYTTQAATSGAVAASTTDSNLQLVAGYDELNYKVDGVENIFKNDVNDAFQCSLEQEKKSSELKQVEFKLWKENKDEIIKQHKEKMVSLLIDWCLLGVLWSYCIVKNDHILQHYISMYYILHIDI